MNAPVVQVTELPDGATPVSLAPAPDPALRVVHTLVRPDLRRVSALVHDVLVAMGKDGRVTGGSHHDPDVVTRLGPWLMAYRTEWVVLFSAQEVTPAVLPGLLDGVVGAGARVLLVADPGHVAVTLAAAAGYGPGRVGYRTWARQNGVVLGPADSRPRPPSDVDVWDGLELPRVDWPWFRARCRDQLAPDRFALVDALYVHALHEFRRRTPAHPPRTSVPRRLDTKPVVRLFGELLDGRYTTAEALVVLRAAQAALVPLGYLLRAEVDSLLNLLSGGDRPAVLTDDQWLALRSYQHAWRAAACALAASGLGVNDTLDLTAGHVWAARDGGTTTLRPGQTVDPRGWPLVMALAHDRVGDGAADHDPLFTTARTTLPRALRDARQDLGLRLGGYIPIRQDRTPQQNWEELAGRRLKLLDLR